jgi:alkylation response protein AidB-like acyl-CoA dehydrogenase
MTGEAVFNEIFIDEAVCDAANLVGGEGNGWAVTQTTLYFERTGIGAGGAHAGFPDPGPKGGMLGRRAGDAALEVPTEATKVVGFPEVVDLARKLGRGDDPAVRQKLARLYAYTETGRWNALRARAEAARRGAGRGAGGQGLANLGKIAQTRIMKLAAEVGIDILGTAGMLHGDHDTDEGRFAHAFVFAPASSIYGGTDEIQRNIIAERGLGLPRESRPDKDVPFRDILCGASN